MLTISRLKIFKTEPYYHTQKPSSRTEDLISISISGLLKVTMEEQNRARDFRENFSQLEDMIDTLERVNLQDPQENIIDKEASTYELLQIQAETQAKALSEAITFITQMTPLQDKTDTQGLIGEAGDKVNVQAQKDYLRNIAEKNNLITRHIQSRQKEKSSKQQYFDSSRDPISSIPTQIANGDQTNVSDSALKLLSTFTGNSENESENLRNFLRSIYDVATTNRLTEDCTAAIIKRKLSGTARKIIDSYELELNTPNRPTLKEIVLKLENRFMADLQPEVANARLAMMKKTPSQTYQSLEGEISELVSLAARAETGDKTKWMKHKKIETFKQAIDESDRQLLFRENQSRTINGIGELNLSEAVDFLIKTYSEKNAFIQANNLKSSANGNDYDSINVAKETDIKKENKTIEPEKAKDSIDEASIKEEIFRLFQQNRNGTQAPSFRGKSQRGKGRGQGRGNGRFRGRGRFNQNNRGYNQNKEFNKNGNGSQWSNNGNRGNQNWNNRGRFNNKGWNNGNYSQRGNNKNGTTPRKFITPEMAGVQPNNCLKCNSPSHRFQETQKCVYGNSNLMTQPCANCHEGAHHSSLCIKANKSTIGAPPPKEERQPLDPNFSKWPESSKSAIEEKDKLYSLFPMEKNAWMPRF